MAWTEAARQAAALARQAHAHHSNPANHPSLSKREKAERGRAVSAAVRAGLGRNPDYRFGAQATRSEKAERGRAVSAAVRAGLARNPDYRLGGKD